MSKKVQAMDVFRTPDLQLINVDYNMLPSIVDQLRFANIDEAHDFFKDLHWVISEELKEHRTSFSRNSLYLLSIKDPQTRAQRIEMLVDERKTIEALSVHKQICADIVALSETLETDNINALILTIRENIK